MRDALQSLAESRNSASTWPRVASFPAMGKLKGVEITNSFMQHLHDQPIVSVRDLNIAAFRNHQTSSVPPSLMICPCGHGGDHASETRSPLASADHARDVTAGPR